MDPLAQAIARSPELFPLTLDPAADQLNLVRLSEADYAQASFLDERVLANPAIHRRLVPWQHVAEAAAGLPEPSASYIFHIGHVGSTLLSRLIGQHARIFSLREPAILRTFAQISSAPGSVSWGGTEFDHRLSITLKLFSRTFRPDQRAVIKVTSFVSELAENILLRQSAPKAIFMFVPAETYLATILGVPNSPAEAKALAPTRLERLHRRIGEMRWKLSELSLGEIIAMSWACEMSALAGADASAGDRIFWLNFDDFLDRPAASLSVIFTHLGIETTSQDIDAQLAGPEMHRYSKAPEHSYNMSLRHAVLAQSRREQAAEIAHGLEWLQKTSAKFSTIPSNYV